MDFRGFWLTTGEGFALQLTAAHQLLVAIFTHLQPDGAIISGNNCKRQVSNPSLRASLIPGR